MIERVGWYSVAINILLTLLNLAISLASGSLAVAAEMVHYMVIKARLGQSEPLV